MDSVVLSEYDDSKEFVFPKQICINLFSYIRKTKNKIPIVFSKTDWLQQDFEIIEKDGRECIIVCGNSDYCVGHSYHPMGEKLVDFVPRNVIKIFSQNCLIKKNHVNYEKFEIIPLGMDNYTSCKRQNYGSIPTHAPEKYNLLNSLDTTIKPKTDILYSNFTLRMDCQSRNHRQLIKDISINSAHIKWQENNLTHEQFYKQVLNHEAIVCAQGNGPGDNHRIYEILYLNRIPITFNPEMYERLHKHFPIVCLEKEDMLRDFSYVKKRIDEVKNKNFNKQFLNSEYWAEKIISDNKKI